MSQPDDVSSEVDRLNVLVTEAICSAERRERASGRRERSAWAEVARWEEALTRILEAGEVEGRIARRGLVSALLKAGWHQDARDAYAAFARESGLRTEDRDAMRALLDEDDARVASRVPALGKRARIAEVLEFASRYARREDPLGKAA